jgi:hypothetical protein
MSGENNNFWWQKKPKIYPKKRKLFRKNQKKIDLKLLGDRRLGKTKEMFRREKSKFVTFFRPLPWGTGKRNC